MWRAAIRRKRSLAELARRARSWEGLLFVVLCVVFLANAAIVPGYLNPQNQVNLLTLSVEKAIVALAMTFVIIGGEIDLSVASIMGLSAILFAWAIQLGVPPEAAIGLALLAGLLCGLNNAFWVAIVGLPSLAVTLAGLIGYRGLALVLIEDRSLGGFPDWFQTLGQRPLLGPIPAAVILFVVLLVVAGVVLHRTGFGRYVYVVGNSAEVARFSGVRVGRVKFALFVLSGVVSAVAGLLLAARFGSVRGSIGQGFELDIITIVLLGGVSIFGGRGTMVGVLLSILVILNLRNGLALVGVSGNTQTGVVGALLILSVLLPNLAGAIGRRARRRARREEPGTAEPAPTSGRVT
jgi:rhamnose transport system permease protein